MVCTIPSNIADLLCSEFELKRLEIEMPEMSLPLLMVWHNSAVHDPANRWLREQICRLYNKDVD